jgi:hypothetical protein
MNQILLHYEGDDVTAIVQSLAAEWPRILANGTRLIVRSAVAPPHRVVVLVRPDCGLLYFTLESGGRFVDEIACVTVQFIEDAFMNSDDDFESLYHQLRSIARSSFLQSALAVAPPERPIAIDNYQSVDPSTLEMLTH